MAFTLGPAALLGIKNAKSTVGVCSNRAVAVAFGVLFIMVGLTMTFGSSALTIYGAATANTTTAPSSGNGSKIDAATLAFATTGSQPPRWW